MIILPDRNIPRARFLMPVPNKEWKQPSLFVPKDEFGNDTTQTRFRVRARINDGYVKWTGWFDDREDFDAFLWAIINKTLKYERELWRLPTPQWHPDIGEILSYDFATVTFLTTTGANATYTSPSDWNNADNEVECIGGGGRGGTIAGGRPISATGGGGGAYASITNFSFATPGTTTATYNVGGNSTGAGNPTWWNDTVNPGSGTTNAKCAAAGGSAGLTSATGALVGPATGGASANSFGQTRFSGGNGGSATASSIGTSTGGGGAAGPNGNGLSSANATSYATTSAGGAGDNGSGGAGGGTGGNTGGTGTEYDATHGSGGGGGAYTTFTTGNATGGAGGNYGGGSGGAATGSGTSATTGVGKQGLIVVTYTPFTSINAFGNSPMLGM